VKGKNKKNKKKIKKLKKNIFVLANKTHTFTYEALPSYYSFMDRLLGC